jgi:hypothetical protein
LASLAQHQFRKTFRHTHHLPQFSYSHASCCGDVIRRTFWSSLFQNLWAG